MNNIELAINNYKMMRTRIKQLYRLFDDLKSEYNWIHHINSLAKEIIALPIIDKKTFEPDIIKANRSSKYQDDMTFFFKKYKTMVINIDEIKYSIKNIKNEIDKLKQQNFIFVKFADSYINKKIQNDYELIHMLQNHYIINFLKHNRTKIIQLLTKVTPIYPTKLYSSTIESKRRPLKMIGGDDSNKNYKILENEGGGDCFFYSIIDSGISFVYRGETINLGQTDKNNRRNMVMRLRQIVVDRIKEKVRSGEYKPSNISWEQINESGFVPHENFNRWFNLMLHSGYWAEEYMITNLAEVANFVPVLINSDDKRINCTVLKNVEFEKMFQFPKGMIIGSYILDEPKKQYYDDINELIKTRKKFILIDYIKLTHFRLIYKDIENKMKGYWDGFVDLDQTMQNKIIKECGFRTRNQAEEVYKQELISYYEKKK